MNTACVEGSCRIARLRAKIALLPWGNVLEDFLDTIGVSLEIFVTNLPGSWMFGYVNAVR